MLTVPCPGQLPRHAFEASILQPRVAFPSRSDLYENLSFDSLAFASLPSTIVIKSPCLTQLMRGILMKGPRKGSGKPVSTAGRSPKIPALDANAKTRHAERHAGGKRSDAREKDQYAASARGFRKTAIILQITLIRTRDLMLDLFLSSRHWL